MCRKLCPIERNAKNQNGCLWNYENSYEKKRRERQRRKGRRYTNLNAEFQSIARRNKKAFLSDQLKQKRKTVEWERLEIFSRKLEIPREALMQRWAQ